MLHPKPRARGLLAAVLAITFLISTTGCAGGHRASVVPVTGKVTLDGEPLKFGTVTFQPSRGQPSQGTIGPDGEFVLSTYREGDGATVGRQKVKITCYASHDPAAKKAEPGPQESLGASLIPEKYTRFDTSGLEVAVLAGGNKPFVFELTRNSQATAGTDDADNAGEKTNAPGSPKQDDPQPAVEPAVPVAKPRGPTG